MAFDIIAKEESISIINVDFHEDRSFLLPESAHQNRRGRRRYLGPNYLALDVVSTRSRRCAMLRKLIFTRIRFLDNSRSISEVPSRQSDGPRSFAPHLQIYSAQANTRV